MHINLRGRREAGLAAARARNDDARSQWFMMQLIPTTTQWMARLVTGRSKQADVKLLRSLVPLNSLDEQRLAGLAAKSVIRRVSAGNDLFKRKGNGVVYLLTGIVEIHSGQDLLTKLIAGTPQAKYPIHDSKLGHVHIRAKSDVSVLEIDVDPGELPGQEDACAGYEIVARQYTNLAVAHGGSGGQGRRCHHQPG
jgi:hypothetical protein